MATLLYFSFKVTIVKSVHSQALAIPWTCDRECSLRNHKLCEGIGTRVIPLLLPVNLFFWFSRLTARFPRNNGVSSRANSQTVPFVVASDSVIIAAPYNFLLNRAITIRGYSLTLFCVETEVSITNLIMDSVPYFTNIKRFVAWSLNAILNMNSIWNCMLLSTEES